MYTLNCKGKLLVLDQPVVMGIINATDDSFYKGDASLGLTGIVSLAGSMLDAGAAILDIGGQSTRPGSERIDAATELQRVIPVIESILSQHPHAILSVDTYHSRVAENAVRAGAAMVNDISGGSFDAEMIPAVAALKVPYICMHMKGTPENMQQHASYEDVVKEVLDYFILRTETCRLAGITDTILDPGFGFAKTVRHNFQLLRSLQVFKMLNKPILTGLSRKSTVYKTLGVSASEALNGTTILNTLAIMNGAFILRVHDVKEAKESIDLLKAFHNA